MRYAREELVAEATAVIPLHHFQLVPADLGNYAAYFQGWLSKAGDTEEALAHARNEAERAVSYILSVTTT
jgi:antirestriction protein ArdC